GARVERQNPFCARYLPLVYSVLGKLDSNQISPWSIKGSMALRNLRSWPRDDVAHRQSRQRGFRQRAKLRAVPPEAHRQADHGAAQQEDRSAEGAGARSEDSPAAAAGGGAQRPEIRLRPGPDAA